MVCLKQWLALNGAGGGCLMKTRIKVYVAGPYSGDNVLSILQNIGRGEKVCAELFKIGFAPFCPWHDKSYVTDNLDVDFTVKQFYDYSMAWLDVSDAILVLPNSKVSEGTQAEIKRAHEIDIPIFFSLADVVDYYL